MEWNKDFIRKAKGVVNLSEIFDLLSKAPFGVKKGLQPILVWAFLSHINSILPFIQMGCLPQI